MHQIANHWTFLITFTSQYKHFKVFSYINVHYSSREASHVDVTYRRISEEEDSRFVWPWHVCFRLLSQLCLFFIVTQHDLRTSVGGPFPLTFINHTHSLVQRKGQTHTPPLVCSDALTHIRKHIFCCVMRQRSYACPSHCHHPPHTQIHVPVQRTQHAKTRRCRSYALVSSCLLGIAEM